MKKFVAAIIFSGFAGAAYGYSFSLNPAEWGTWPDYCKAKYVVTNVGAVSRYRRLVSQEFVKKWEGLMGYDTWPNIHHGCAGLIWITRAERLKGKNAQQFEHALNNAHSEATYSITRTDPSHPFWAKMAMVLARVDYNRGKTAHAIATLYKIAEQVPTLAESYTVLGAYLFREKKFAEAREVLERGIETVDKPTAEMHYFLGLVLLRQKDYAQAREQAEQAYSLGYPLPGLRNKLRSVGHWDT